MPNMDIVETEVVVREVDAAIDDVYDVHASETGGGDKTASPLSGFGKVLVTVNDVLIDNANQSTIMALIMVFLLLFIVFKSWRIALITILPVTLVVFWQYAAIWGIGAAGNIIAPGESMFSGDLNLFTALIGSIIIGIGVDFSIHITERIREKNFTLEGVMYAADTSGWSFIEATTTMVMGLTAVFLVNIPSIREFILLVIILLIFSAYSAIFILTSAYKLYLPRYNKLKSLKKIKG
jgi:predicted RND superfamily exporter protein